MLKQALALKGVSNQNVTMEQLCAVTDLTTKAAFTTAAFNYWLNVQGQSSSLLSDPNVSPDKVLTTKDEIHFQPVIFHHIKQRLTAEQAQLYVSVIGSSDGKLLDVPLLQLSDHKTWFTNNGLNQQVEVASRRAELQYALAWAEKKDRVDSSVHWVEEHTSQLWQQWQQNAMNVMTLVAPATRCWYLNQSTTPIAIVKQLDFIALNHTKMPLPYHHIAGVKRKEQSFWYAQTPIQLRARGGQAINLQLYALKLINSKDLTELKTYYTFGSFNQNTAPSAEQIGVWLLQHTESKHLLRLMGRAYHHQTLQNFIKQHQLNTAMALKLSALLGGTSWELDQYQALRPINQLLLALSGKNALQPSQITSSLLKLFSLKQQITH